MEISLIASGIRINLKDREVEKMLGLSERDEEIKSWLPLRTWWEGELDMSEKYRTSRTLAKPCPGNKNLYSGSVRPQLLPI